MFSRTPSISSTELLELLRTVVCPNITAFAGFRIGQQYQLTYTREFDEVRLVLDHHAHMSPGTGPLVMTVERFEKWFRR